MPVPPFGFSIGDFVSITTILKDIRRASGEGTKEYDGLVQTAECLHLNLDALTKISREHTLSPSQQVEVARFEQSSRAIVSCIREILKKYSTGSPSFQATLSLSGTPSDGPKLHRAWKLLGRQRIEVEAIHLQLNSLNLALESLKSNLTESISHEAKRGVFDGELSADVEDNITDIADNEFGRPRPSESVLSSLSLTKELFVGSLAWHTTSDTLRAGFEAFGRVVHARVVRDRDTESSKGFGYVTFESAESADEARRRLDRTEFDGRIIMVDHSHPRLVEATTLGPDLPSEQEQNFETLRLELMKQKSVSAPVAENLVGENKIAFAIPLHPTPTTYRSQSYSVSQLDPEVSSMKAPPAPGITDASDTESEVSASFSDTSINTMVTKLTDYSDAQVVEACQELFLLIADDEDLRICFQESAKNDLFSRSEFEDALRRRLKIFAKSLAKELSGRVKPEDISFISQQSGKTARSVRELHFPGSSNQKDSDTRGSREGCSDDSDDEVGEVEDSSGDEMTDGDVEPPSRFADMRHMLAASVAMQALRESFQRLLRRRYDPWRACRALWARELGYSIPAILPDTIISVVESSQLTLKDRVQWWLEDYTGSEWIWHPWNSPRKRPAKGKVCIQWRCECGKLNFEAIPHELAGLIKSLQSQAGDNFQRNAFVDVIDSPGDTSPSGPPSTSQSGPKGPGSSRSTSYMQPKHNGRAHDRSRTRVHSAFADRFNNPTNVLKTGFILLCVPRGSTLKSETIKLRFFEEPQPVCELTDKEFFDAFRAKYRKLRGRWRYWFGPDQFAFCHASRFEKYDLERLGWRRNEYPGEKEAQSSEEYFFQPKPARDPYEAPLSKEEWQDRFHRRVEHPSSTNVTQRLPKRKVPFKLVTDPTREEMWGLHVQLQPSAIVVFAWNIAVLLGGVVFGIFWLAKHHQDWYQAFIPLTATMGAYGTFWNIIQDKYKVKRE